MSATAAVIAKLLAATPVTSLVENRIRPVNLAPKDALPGVVVNIISGYDEPTLAGAGQYYRHRMQTDCLATTATAALAVGDAVMDVLNGVINETIGGCKDVTSLFAGIDFTDYGEDLTVYRRVLQFDVWWRKA